MSFKKMMTNSAKMGETKLDARFSKINRPDSTQSKRRLDQELQNFK